MATRVILAVQAGPMAGQSFVLEGHETFIFGRALDCNARLSREDKKASRHHFLIEACPPRVRLRDLGSLNGTKVNGVKHGGRDREQGPESGSASADIALKDGDRIQAGQTSFELRIEDEGPDFEATEFAEEEPEATIFDEGTAEQLKALAETAVLEAGGARRIGRYGIERELGRGGMGVVYQARAEDGRAVALKVLLAQRKVSDRERASFLREVKLLRGIAHENCVAFLDEGAAGDGFFFVMELCPGGCVGGLMKARGGRLDLDEARPIMLDALSGLAAIHEAGIVHRDLKPPNILLAAEGGPAKVSDFGLAKRFADAGFSGMTLTGAASGTPHFMPREQLINFKYVQPSSDIWSMGASFYCMLTGRVPFPIRKGKDPVRTILREKVVPIRERDPSLPEPIAAVIDRAVALAPDARFASAGAFRENLAEAFGAL